MSYCEHCEGQRFDRARVLRALRQLQKEVAASPDGRPDEALDRALKAVRALDLPHPRVGGRRGGRGHSLSRARERFYSGYKGTVRARFSHSPTSVDGPCGCTRWKPTTTPLRICSTVVVIGAFGSAGLGKLSGNGPLTQNRVPLPLYRGCLRDPKELVRASTGLSSRVHARFQRKVERDRLVTRNGRPRSFDELPVAIEWFQQRKAR